MNRHARRSNAIIDRICLVLEVLGFVIYSLMAAAYFTAGTGGLAALSLLAAFCWLAFALIHSLNRPDPQMRAAS